MSAAALALGVIVGAFPGSTAAATTGTASRPPRPGAVVARSTSAHWSVVRLGGTADLTLNVVTALSPRDAWAVGQPTGDQTSAIPPVLHWDGTSWQVVQLPQFRGYALEDVEAPSLTDVWIVGAIADGARQRVLVACLSARGWTFLPVVHADYFSDVIPGDNQVWISGSTSQERGHRPVTPLYHWNGQRWIVSDARVAISQLSAAGPSDLWAIATPTMLMATPPTDLYHLEARGWTHVRTPALGDGVVLDMVSPASGWLATRIATPIDGRLYHWDGASWTSVPGPSGASARGDCLTGLLVPSGSGLWTSAGCRYTGSGWDEVDGPFFSAATWSGDFSDVAPIPGSSSAWLVGDVALGARAPTTMIARLVPPA